VVAVSRAGSLGREVGELRSWRRGLLHSRNEFGAFGFSLVTHCRLRSDDVDLGIPRDRSMGVRGAMGGFAFFVVGALIQGVA